MAVGSPLIAQPARARSSRLDLPSGPVRTVTPVLEIATLSWAHRFNNTRLHGALGHVPPVESELQHYRQITAQQQALPA